MHAGQFTTLEQAIRHYMRAPATALGRSEITAGGRRNAGRITIRLDAADVQDLAAFLGSLTGPVLQTAQ
jgi:cytochrome c peroxidase